LVFFIFFSYSTFLLAHISCMMCIEVHCYIYINAWNTLWSYSPPLLLILIHLFSLFLQFLRMSFIMTFSYMHTMYNCHESFQNSTCFYELTQLCFFNTIHYYLQFGKNKNIYRVTINHCATQSHCTWLLVSLSSSLECMPYWDGQDISSECM
jgi:hypothetical protein